MKDRFKKWFDHFKQWNDNFAEHVGQILSWSIWMSLIVIVVSLWIIAVNLSHGRFDKGFVVLVLILTIQTSLDSQATKLFQLSLRKKDQQHEQQQAETIARIEKIVTSNENHDQVLIKIVTAMDLAVDKLVERSETDDSPSSNSNGK